MDRIDLIKLIRDKVASDRRWAIRALAVAYRENLIPIIDRQLLHGIHEFRLKSGFITDKQLAVVQEKLPKYAAKLEPFIDHHKLGKILNES